MLRITAITLATGVFGTKITQKEELAAALINAAVNQPTEITPALPPSGPIVIIPPTPPKPKEKKT